MAQRVRRVHIHRGLVRRNAVLDFIAPPDRGLQLGLDHAHPDTTAQWARRQCLGLVCAREATTALRARLYRLNRYATPHTIAQQAPRRLIDSFVPLATTAQRPPLCSLHVPQATIAQQVPLVTSREEFALRATIVQRLHQTPLQSPALPATTVLWDLSTDSGLSMVKVSCILYFECVSSALLTLFVTYSHTIMHDHEQEL